MLNQEFMLELREEYNTLRTKKLDISDWASIIWKNMKILVVEDEVKIAGLIRKALEIEKYVVDLAYDGQAGLERAAKGNYDLIIMDVMLPGIDGMEVCKALRRKRINTPVIMLTARDSAEDKVLGLDAGADDYLVKPFTFEKLNARIKSVLRLRKINNEIYPSDIEDDSTRQKGLKSTSKKIVAKRAGARSEKTKNSSRDVFFRPPIGKNVFDKANSDRAARIIELNQTILDNAPISIITIDKKGFITSANKYFENFSKNKDHIGHNILKGKFFIRENLVADYKKLLVDGTMVRKDNCYEKNSRGEDKYLKIIAVPFRDERGKIAGALSMAIDNTEAVLFENKILELNNNLEKTIKHRTIELKETNEELSKVLKLKSMFMADVSHELRTSLAIMQGNLELMTMDNSIAKDRQESEEQIFNEIKRMTMMLEDLSLLTKSDSSDQHLNYEKVEIDRLILSICRSIEIVADKKKIRIECQRGKKILS